MMEGCKEYGMPEPRIEEAQGGIRITFLKDIYTEEHLKTLDLNKRQIKAILFTKEKGEITNSDYQTLNDISLKDCYERFTGFSQKRYINIKRSKRSGCFLFS